DDQLLDDGKTLGECGFTSQTARPQAPATVGLAFRADDTFEALCIEPFSSPPELPDVMKPQDSGSSANEQAVHAPHPHTLHVHSQGTMAKSRNTSWSLCPGSTARSMREPQSGPTQVHPHWGL
uniref:Ubiquitin-like domain-containing protein n=1 Tax=Colobus angolensis palliatus TaxID=336983 RepID=A0A2K5K8T7_COLAP